MGGSRGWLPPNCRVSNIERVLWWLNRDLPKRRIELILCDDWQADPTGNKGCRILLIQPKGETDGQIPEH